MKTVESVEKELSSWSEVSVHSHRFGGTEFRFGSAEIGHVHNDGTVDIPFPRSIHDALLAAGLAEKHRWLPNSGWISFRMRSEQDTQRALWLMRLSYVRYSLKRTAAPADVLQRESQTLKLSSQFESLLAQLIPPKTNHLVETHAR
jgi:hypothetical protein